MAHVYWFSDQNIKYLNPAKFYQVEGVVDTIPANKQSKTQFQFIANKINDTKVYTKILVSCYQNCPKLNVGQHWSMMLKLHKPHNLNNPGGFDYEQLMHTKHISWLGVTKINSFNYLFVDSYKKYWLLNLRQKYSNTLSELFLDSQTLGIVQALTVGFTENISKNQWDLFRRTGVTHLMVISGAHIGLVTGFIYGIVRWLWSVIPYLCLRLPAQKIAAICGIFAAIMYSLIAGFNVPSQRALISCVFMLLSFISDKNFSTWQAWRYALCFVLLLEPHSVLLSGFYLSFAAVAILIATNKRFPLNSIKLPLFYGHTIVQRLLHGMCLQVACLIGLMPYTLYYFSYASINGFFANIIAIPLVGLLLVPLSLVTLIVSKFSFASWLKLLITILSSFLLKYLSFIDYLSLYNINFYLNNILLLISSLLIIGILFFCPLRSWLIVLPIIILGMFMQNKKINFGEVLIDVLDVGQGLSVLVRTMNHRLIYDTGIKFYRGGDMANLVILPYLNTLKINFIDKIVISHPDLDHKGGLDTLEKTLSVQELIVDQPSFYRKGHACHSYQDWVWDGVRFHFFSIKKHFNSKNNNSCVLQIINQAGKILLTGDIEIPAEKYLVEQYGSQLASDIILVPHHASKTSSSEKFLKILQAKYALVSYGIDNKYHFPHIQITKKYKKLNIPLYSTAKCGMISIFLPHHKSDYSPKCYVRR